MTDKQPKALRLADLIDQNLAGAGDAEIAAELRRLHDENQKLRADAERYRWLRETRFIHSDFSYIAHNSKKVVGLEFGWFDAPANQVPTRNDLDAAIDAERNQP